MSKNVFNELFMHTLLYLSQFGIYHIYFIYAVCDKIIIFYSQGIAFIYVVIAILMIRQVIRVTSSTWQVLRQTGESSSSN